MYRKPEQANEIVARNMKKLRVANNMLIKTVADLLGVNRNTYSAHENGKAQVSASEILALSALYGIPVEWFYAEELEVNVQVQRKTILVGNSQADPR